MNRTYTPAQIAEEHNVSTTTLRRYEEQGLIPDVPRTAGGHRIYMAIHVQAFKTIRTLLLGFDIPVVYDAMRRVKAGDSTKALWLLNNQLYRMELEKQRVEHILAMIEAANVSRYQEAKVTGAVTIGRAAEMAGVNTSAIRHWEKEGLIASERDPANGYRMFPLSEVRKILVISSLRKTIYYIENLKELLKDLETQDISNVDRSFRLALERLDQRLTVQFQGIAELMAYIGLLR
ncbi:MerR family DNA-binding transcriptional regulator [Paenibacillus nanensis]|uniref:MerR family DNA-binding transcriptional regulator n=1 Tax=Paenibacillus nanensis TaxID=393251 RepID=A0A3A1UXG1_9BACL|nr:MerR family DNA-binding transcriptional regulator [Paenibacillus nanensis]RIX52111.1 MerR family DNA-binding transcriptional regulator [Paenibacillus nanensis]